MSEGLLYAFVLHVRASLYFFLSSLTTRSTFTLLVKVYLCYTYCEISFLPIKLKMRMRRKKNELLVGQHDFTALQIYPICYLVSFLL